MDCGYKILSSNLTSNTSLKLIFNTKYSYFIRIEQSNTSCYLKTFEPYENEFYVLTVENQSTNSSSNRNFTCTISLPRSTIHAYVPLIVAGVLLLILFLACIVAQRMKFDEYLKTIQKRFTNKTPTQEATHAEMINTNETNPTVARLPPIQKVSSVIVPRSKRLLSLDAFRGLSKSI